jgi:hypothetical protein
VKALVEVREMEGSEVEMVEEDVGMKAQRKFFPVVAAMKSSTGRKTRQGVEVCIKSRPILLLF